MLLWKGVLLGNTTISQRPLSIATSSARAPASAVGRLGAATVGGGFGTTIAVLLWVKSTSQRNAARSCRSLRDRPASSLHATINRPTPETRQFFSFLFSFFPFLFSLSAARSSSHLVRDHLSIAASWGSQEARKTSRSENATQRCDNGSRGFQVTEHAHRSLARLSNKLPNTQTAHSCAGRRQKY